MRLLVVEIENCVGEKQTVYINPAHIETISEDEGYVNISLGVEVVEDITTPLDDILEALGSIE